MVSVEEAAVVTVLPVRPGKTKWVVFDDDAAGLSQLIHALSARVEV